MINAFMRKLRGLADLTVEAEAAVRSLPAERITVDRHRTIIRKDSSPAYLCVIVSGWAARISKRSDGSPRITGFMLAGDFCGIHAISRAAMDHDIVAITGCELLKIPMLEVRKLLVLVPAVEIAIWRAKLVDEAMLRQWLLSSADALQAVARLLCELHARATAAGLCHERLCEMPLTQEQIGDATGFTAVHTNRVIQRLRKSGLVSTPRGQLQILDAPELFRLARWKPANLKPWAD